MGKRIIQQARGHGGPVYRVRRKAFSIKPSYLTNLSGEFEIVKLILSAGHSAPIIKLKAGDKVFYNLAANGLYQGQKIKIGGTENGDITELKNLKNGTFVFNVENRSKDGGKFIRTGGNSGIIVNQGPGYVGIKMPSKQERKFNPDCRATIGIIAGDGRQEKPIVKAGKNFYIKGAKSKLWPRTSAIKMNAIDHPFGGGRGKRIKSKICKTNSPPGAKVGLLRPRRTGRKKK